MEKKEVTVKFNTITPIWTGDAWGECKELKPTAIIGSLRFWFEVYCNFAGIEIKEKEELNYNKFREELEKEFKKDPEQDIDKLSFEIASKMLTLPSLIFGCTGWRSRIEVEDIKPPKNNNSYPYPSGKFSLESLKYKKEYFDKRKKKKKVKYIIPSWYFQKGFYGEFEITFKASNEVKVKVLLPLLKYIQKYGFIGAKNNLGYGRVEIIEPNLDGFEFDFNEFGESKIITESIFETVKRFNIQSLDSKKLQILSLNYGNNDLKTLIKGLLATKAKLRRKINNNNDRHYIFGFTSNNNNEATKIIPLISKDNENYIGDFLSIVGIKDFGERR